MLEKRHKEHMLELLLYSADVFCCPSLDLCCGIVVSWEMLFTNILWWNIKQSSLLFWEGKEFITIVVISTKVDDVEWLFLVCSSFFNWLYFVGLDFDNNEKILKKTRFCWWNFKLNSTVKYLKNVNFRKQIL